MAARPRLALENIRVCVSCVNTLTTRDGAKIGRQRRRRIVLPGKKDIFSHYTPEYFPPGNTKRTSRNTITCQMRTTTSARKLDRYRDSLGSCERRERGSKLTVAADVIGDVELSITSRKRNASKRNWSLLRNITNYRTKGRAVTATNEKSCIFSLSSIGKFISPQDVAVKERNFLQG